MAHHHHHHAHHGCTWKFFQILGFLIVSALIIFGIVVLLVHKCDYGNHHHTHELHKKCPATQKHECAEPYNSYAYRYHNASNSHPSSLGVAGSWLKRHGKKNERCTYNMPEPRIVSDAVCHQDAPLVPNECGLTGMTWLWGQFVDHSITIVKEVEHTVVPIAGVMNIKESEWEEDRYGHRQQINSLSCFLDGSSVYGSDDVHAHELRAHAYGKMKVGHYSYGTGLPHKKEDKYDAGDVRAAENSALAAMHTLWLKEHNWWASCIYAENPDWDDEKIYQHARACVIGEIQAITYNEFLPALLGKYAPGDACYDPHIDPSLFNEFSAASYRFGHSMVNENLDCDGQYESSFSLRDAFFAEKPSGGNFYVCPPEKFLMGIIKKKANKIDAKIVSALRNFLFSNTSTPNPMPPVDLASMNIARGRHHNLPSYAQMRWMFTGDKIRDWDDVCQDDQVTLSKLKHVYSGCGWECLDLWVGLLVEDHEKGVPMGKTLAKMLAHQFKLIRDGDAHFYLWNEHVKPYAYEIHHTKLMHVIKRNYNTYADSTIEDAFHGV